MPARVRKVGAKFRIVEPDGTLITRSNGDAVDGGGHTTRAQAMAQAQAINLNSSGPRASRRRRKRFDKGQDLA